jgi:hypothetical protein
MQGFVVGSLSGTCRFYVASGIYLSVCSMQEEKYREFKVISNLNFMVLGKQFQLEAKIRVNEKKKRSAGNKITGIQVFFLEILHCQVF